jgi:NTP pyrophosphatase (non-canonical NTP hydrolase)
MDINKLIKDCHTIALEKGFWKSSQNIKEKLMLIISECGETLEAHRKNKCADLKSYDEQIVNEDSIVIFKKYIKDTIEDEIADIFIRLFDLCGYLKIEFIEKEYKDIVNYNYYNIFTSDNFGENLFVIVKYICCIDCTNKSDLIIILNKLCWFCNKYNINIERYIYLKMDYNKTREKLHGKNY